MFAVYATHAAPDDPLAALKIGEQPEPNVPEGWVRVKISHASLNRHDLFTLRGMSGHPEGITYPIILGMSRQFERPNHSQRFSILRER
jgi:NADPH:quinone reductase-like Zn-dependent oxidoreductase